MTVKTDYCHNCSRLTLTGYIACVHAQLCARCAAPILGVTEEEAENALEFQEAAQQVIDE